MYLNRRFRQECRRLWGTNIDYEGAKIKRKTKRRDAECAERKGRRVIQNWQSEAPEQGSAWEANLDFLSSEELFELADRLGVVVEDGGGQGSVGCTFGEDLGEVFGK